MIGDPTAQASAFRTTTAGPQEQEDLRTVYESVINRLKTIETNQRKHAQLIDAHSTTINLNTERCEYLMKHVGNVEASLRTPIDEASDRIRAYGLQGQEMIDKIKTMHETLENLKNMRSHSPQSTR